MLFFPRLLRDESEERPPCCGKEKKVCGVWTPSKVVGRRFSPSPGSILSQKLNFSRVFYLSACPPSGGDRGVKIGPSVHPFFLRRHKSLSSLNLPLLPFHHSTSVSIFEVEMPIGREQASSRLSDKNSEGKPKSLESGPLFQILCLRGVE
ncbi:uncharacterized protein BJX67DRAFT_315105 [Aspergillus lucknowensis]|uniref:Uncharacterized protein n=1 Tax=Aspergillus lucknowensis TaxID=176173 RepID=A0ABR4L9Q4_9EURO